MRYAKIENNIVVNIIKATQDFIDTLEGLYIQSDIAKKGDIWNGTEFTTPKPIFDSEKAKDKKLKNLKESYQEKINAIYKYYPAFELETFSIQKEEWMKYQQNSNSSTPFVDNLAQSRKTSKKEIMDKIGASIAKIAKLQGELQMKRSLISKAKTIEDLNSINVR